MAGGLEPTGNVFDFTLKNTGSAASINGGNPIWFIGSRYTKQNSWLNKYPPRNSGAIVDGNQGGKENPAVTVEGFIDTDYTTGAYTINNQAASVKANETLLIQLANLTQSVNSRIRFIAAYKGNKSNPVTMSDNTGGRNGYDVMIDAFTLDVPADSLNNHLWNITMTMREIGS